jgi:transcriptional regulator with XRE-family HTH domain
MPVSVNNVLRVNCAEEQTCLLEACNEVIRRIIAEYDFTLIQIAESIGVTVATISNAFNKKHVLSQTFLNRLGKRFGVHVLDPVAALSGARMVPINPNADRDILPFLNRAALKIAEARDPKSPGGVREIHTERADYVADLRAVVREATALICQIEAELAA